MIYKSNFYIMLKILNKANIMKHNLGIKLFISAIVMISLVMKADITMAINTRASVKEGNRLYNEKKYDQALTKYQDALLSEPKNEKIEFNIANSLYMKKKYEDALKTYQKILGSQDINLDEQAYFNIGNTLYRMGKLPESILAYQQALKLNPNDMDAKYNLEFVRKKLKEQMEKQNKDQNQMSSQNKLQQQKNEESKQQQQSQQQEKKDQSKEQQQLQAVQQEKQKKLTREEAERILDALKYDEKDIQKKRRMVPPADYKVEKDW